MTAATRKWRRGLARASRVLEEPRPRGPARRHTARSRDHLSCSPPRSRDMGSGRASAGAQVYSAGFSPSPAEDPGGQAPGSPRKRARTQVSPRHYSGGGSSSSGSSTSTPRIAWETRPGGPRGTPEVATARDCVQSLAQAQQSSPSCRADPKEPFRGLEWGC